MSSDLGVDGVRGRDCGEPCTFEPCIGRAALDGAREEHRDLRACLVAQAPTVVCEAAAIIGRQRVRAVPERAEEHVHGTHVAQDEVEHLGVDGYVHATSNARKLAAVCIESKDRWIPCDREFLTPSLRAGIVAIEIDGNEQLELLLNVAAREHVSFEVRAVRAPHGAPVEKHGPAAGFGLCEPGLDVVGPGNARRRVGEGHRCGGRVRGCFGFVCAPRLAGEGRNGRTENEDQREAAVHRRHRISS
jgi:hypothetical protein